MLLDQNLPLTRDGPKKCFGCGEENPLGLKLKFLCDGDTVSTEFIPSDYHQGWPGFVHGGILFTVLDEAMGYTFFSQGMNGVTAKMEVRFRQLVPIGKPVLISAAITKRTKRLIETKATATLDDGVVAAEAKAVMYVVANT